MAETMAEVRGTQGEQVYEPAFLQLPTEIRLQIYDHLLPNLPIISTARQGPRLPKDKCVSTSPIFPDRWKLRTDDTQTEMSIMRVNQQIHAEASEYLYQGRALGLTISAPMSSFAAFRMMRDNSKHLDRRREVIHRFQHIHIVMNACRQIPGRLPDGRIRFLEDYNDMKTNFERCIAEDVDCLKGCHWKGKRLDICYLYNCDPMYLADNFETHLRPFLQITGLARVSIEVRNRCKHDTAMAHFAYPEEWSRPDLHRYKDHEGPLAECREMAAQFSNIMCSTLDH